MTRSLSATLMIIATLVSNPCPSAKEVSAPAGWRESTPKPRAASEITFIVNTSPSPKAIGSTVAAIKRSGGIVTMSWPQIGVVVGAASATKASKIVAHLRTVKGIESAGFSGRIIPDDRRPRVERPVPMKGPEIVNFNVKDSRSVQANAMATGEGVTVAIADDGVFEEHEDISGRFDKRRSGSCLNGGAPSLKLNSWRPSFINGENGTHGTGVAGVVGAAANGVGTRGIAPQASIAAIRVVNNQGDIFPEASICAAMIAAISHIPIVNHSYTVDYVGSLSHNFWNPVDKNQQADIDAINKAFSWSRSHGTLNVVGAGNSGEDVTDKPHIPLAHSDGRLQLTSRMQALLVETPSVLGVSESDPEGNITFMSTVGMGKVRLSAVGTGMHLSHPGRLDKNAGTSFASPVVAGVAALVKQARPDATPEQIASILADSARKVTCRGAGIIQSEQPCRMDTGGVTNYFGRGHVNALNAVTLAKKGQPGGGPSLTISPQ